MPGTNAKNNSAELDNVLGQLWKGLEGEARS